MTRFLAISTILVCGLAIPVAAQQGPKPPAGDAAAESQPVPDAFAVEWQGKHPCEKLYEDAEIRIGLCTFPPGTVHVRHTHPAYFAYVLSGGKGRVQDARGTRFATVKTGSYYHLPPVPWHVFANAGDTTITYLIVEQKYEPVTEKDQAASK